MSKFDDTLRDDYDFTDGVRGKYSHFSDQPRTFRIRQPDGSVIEKTTQAPITLDPDVRHYFPDSEAVNRALRGLIELMPEGHSDSPREL